MLHGARGLQLALRRGIGQKLPRQTHREGMVGGVIGRRNCATVIRVIGLASTAAYAGEGLRLAEQVRWLDLVRHLLMTARVILEFLAGDRSHGNHSGREVSLGNDPLYSVSKLVQAIQLPPIVALGRIRQRELDNGGLFTGVVVAGYGDAGLLDPGLLIGKLVEDPLAYLVGFVDGHRTMLRSGTAASLPTAFTVG